MVTPFAKLVPVGTPTVMSLVPPDGNDGSLSQRLRVAPVVPAGAGRVDHTR